MKKKINFYFFLFSAVSILLAVILSNIASYTMLQKEVYSDLEACARALEGTGSFQDVNHISYTHDGVTFRVTLIASDGEVIYDSDAELSQVQNHNQREEVQEARKYGEGRAVRRSETMQKNTYYFAILLDNGCVLRLSKDANSLLSVLLSELPTLFIILIILILLSIYVTHFLTGKILAPIQQMANNVDTIEINEVYKEIRPFIRRIQSQHKSVLQNAQMRQEFTANVSHELKTPLTAISGYAELMENGMTSQQDNIHFAGEIHRNANRLLGLINDTIRLSELDSMQYEMPAERLDLSEIAQNCVNTLQIKADKHGVKLHFAGQPCLMNASREMMAELVYNLCDNAIRYNKKDGRVLVFVGENEEGCPFLEVKDTGIGIPKEHQERVFERFYRVDKSRSKSTGGTGLGLAIVKHIAVQNQARLVLESEPDQGTRIRIIFPADNAWRLEDE
ncbi:MAG: ATP-binding protein [Clostridiaceae bacterium]|nr:ATP-binding protein [Clostridiaceae bacterium]